MQISCTFWDNLIFCFACPNRMSFKIFPHSSQIFHLFLLSLRIFWSMYRRSPVPLVPLQNLLSSFENHGIRRKKFKVCVCSLFLTNLCCLTLSNWRCRFSTLFLSPGDYLQVAVVNKPYMVIPSFLRLFIFNTAGSQRGLKSICYCHGTIS